MQSLLVSALRSLVLSLLATITIVTVSPPILFHGLLDRGKLQLGFGIVRDGNASIVAKNIETKLSAIIPPPNILPGITPGQCETPSLTDSLTTSSLPPDIQVHWQRKVTVKIQEASESKQSNSTTSSEAVNATLGTETIEIFSYDIELSVQSRRLQVGGARHAYASVETTPISSISDVPSTRLDITAREFWYIWFALGGGLLSLAFLDMGHLKYCETSAISEVAMGDENSTPNGSAELQLEVATIVSTACAQPDNELSLVDSERSPLYFPSAVSVAFLQVADHERLAYRPPTFEFVRLLAYGTELPFAHTKHPWPLPTAETWTDIPNIRPTSPVIPDMVLFLQKYPVSITGKYVRRVLASGDPIPVWPERPAPGKVRINSTVLPRLTTPGPPVARISAVVSDPSGDIATPVASGSGLAIAPPAPASRASGVPGPSRGGGASAPPRGPTPSRSTQRTRKHNLLKEVLLKQTIIAGSSQVKSSQTPGGESAASATQPSWLYNNLSLPEAQPREGKEKMPEMSKSP